jgi:hypothetical protein
MELLVHFGTNCPLPTPAWFITMPVEFVNYEKALSCLMKTAALALASLCLIAVSDAAPVVSSSTNPRVTDHDP